MYVADHHTLDELQHLVRKEPDGKLRDRIRAVALAREGKTTPQIVQGLKVPRRSVQRWVGRYNARGLDGLRHRKGGGARPRLKDDQQDRLRARLDAGPTAEDGVCAWGGRAVGEVLRKEFGVVLKLDAVYKLLHRMNYSWLCVRPRHPRSDPAAREAFKKSARHGEGGRGGAPRQAGAGLAPR